MADSFPSVLVVDDEPNVAKAYSLWLDDEYDVEIAHDGHAALDAISEETDVVLLDRRMPNASGDEALRAIREAGYDCRVAMVTAVDPDVDIVDMPFDAYLSKPVTREDVVETIEELLDLAAYDEALAERFRVEHKIAALESRHSGVEIAGNEGYRQLKERAEMLADRAERELDHDSMKKALGDIGTASETAF